jgi:hypothetical protein
LVRTIRLQLRGYRNAGTSSDGYTQDIALRGFVT